MQLKHLSTTAPSKGQSRLTLCPLDSKPKCNMCKCLKRRWKRNESIVYPSSWSYIEGQVTDGFPDVDVVRAFESALALLNDKVKV